MYFYVAIAAVVFLVIMFLVSFWTKKFIASSSDYLLAGRELSYGINMMAVVAAGFAGTTLSITPAWFMLYGFWGAFLFGASYALFGDVLYGLLFARIIRRSGAHTLPEWLEMRFDYRVRRVLSILGVIGIIAVLANNVLALANVITGYFGLNLVISITIGVVTFLGFTYFSGMWGVSLTDFIQAILSCVGAPLLLIFCIKTFGGVELAANTWFGNYGSMFQGGISGGSIPFWGLSYPSVVTVLLNFGVFLIWGNQTYWIRMASARSEEQARFGYVVAGVILFVITVLIGFIGLYAGAFYGSEFTPMGGPMPPTSAYGHIISYFPSLIGVFLLMFALVASLDTAASYLIAAVSIVSKDIYPFFIRKNPTETQTLKASKIATVVISGLAWFLAYYPGGTTFLFAFATSWMAPAGLLLVLGVSWRRCTPTGAFVSAASSLICMSIWVVLDLFKIPVYHGLPIGSFVHMGIVGLVTAIVPAIVVSLVTKPKYYGQPDWTLRAPAAERV